MMIDGGIIIMLASLAMMIAAPVQTPLPVRRAARAFGCSVALRTAFPVAATGPAFADLVAQADAAVERTSLLSGIRSTSATYDQA